MEYLIKKNNLEEYFEGKIHKLKEILGILIYEEEKEDYTVIYTANEGIKIQITNWIEQLNLE